MGFPDDVVATEWRIVRGRCEKCHIELIWSNRGRYGYGAWEAHHMDSNPNHDSITNCQILCWECHAKTF